MQRRDLLRLTGAAGLTLVGGSWLAACSSSSDTAGPGDGGGSDGTPTEDGSPTTAAPFTGYGPLGEPDANGLRLPAGFTSRVVATAGEVVAATGFVWPANPDGGAVFPADDGGWIYVVNAETGEPEGGVSMVRFDPDGAIVEARSILTGTSRNCAGGATPWDTWLSCEEVPDGQVYECDPTGATAAQVRPAMGSFMHEAAAVDPDGEAVYLTEDLPDGAFYRFVPTAYPDLAAGTLEVLVDDDGALSWQPVPEPGGTPTATKDQVPGTRRFDGGEGACFLDGTVFFTTKGDNRVWAYEPAGNVLSVVYEATSPLTGVDNITAAPTGDLYVAEDGGDMQVVLVTGDRVEPVVEITGTSGSEVTGPAFTPDGTRLYLSSQRDPGRTYEVTGPWHWT